MDLPTKTTQIRAMVLAVVVLGGLAAVATPVTADMHAACDKVDGQDFSQLPAGPTGYANVELTDRPGTAALTYEGVLYCPGAEFLDVRLEVATPQGTTLANTSLDACTATVSSPCTLSGTVDLEPGTYWVNMTFDVNDPQETEETGREPEYQDTRRAQRFRWEGAAQPVPTCPDLGYVHFNPPCV